MKYQYLYIPSRLVITHNELLFNIDTCVRAAFAIMFYEKFFRFATLID